MITFATYFSYSPKKDKLVTGHPATEWLYNRLHKKNKNFICNTVGSTGCLDEKTTIKIFSEGKIVYQSLKDAPTIFSVPSWNFEQKKFVINTARKVFSGEKQVYRLHLSNGDFIDATEDHRFFLSGGKEITVGELLKKYETKYKDQVRPFKDYRVSLASKQGFLLNENHFWKKEHSFETRKKMHQREFQTGIRAYNRPFMLSQLPDHCERCNSSAKEKRLLVHHRDGNRKNNVLSNLERVCFSCHSVHHEHGVLNPNHPRNKAKVLV